MTATAQMLEIPELRSRISPITVAQYHQFPEFNENGRHTELVRGLVIEKMSKSPLHSSIARRLLKTLQMSLPPGFILLREDPLTFSDSEPEPDLAIVRGSEEDYSESHPKSAALVVEIAITSAAEDRSLAALYAEAGVDEYWIVLPSERRIEVYAHPQNGIYSDHSMSNIGSTLQCGSVPGVEVNLDELFH